MRLEIKGEMWRLNLLVGEQVDWLLLSSVEYYLDCITKIDTHLMGIVILLCLLGEPLLGLSILALQTKDWLNWRDVSRETSDSSLLCCLGCGLGVWCQKSCTDCVCCTCSSNLRSKLTSCRLSDSKGGWCTSILLRTIIQLGFIFVLWNRSCEFIIFRH